MTRAPAELRPDLRLIADLIPAGDRVLDLGCGDGALLDHLVHGKGVKGRGIELSEAGVLACVRRGLSVRQGNLQEGLADYPDGRFGTVVLSQTLPFLDDPAMVLAEMVRVGQRAIVSFPNWGYWRCRLQLLLDGRIPQAPDIPQRWHDAPRWQAFTVADFVRFCHTVSVRVDQATYLAGERLLDGARFMNLRATTAVFTLARGTQSDGQKP